jgi:hypothetical protein
LRITNNTFEKNRTLQKFKISDEEKKRKQDTSSKKKRKKNIQKENFKLFSKNWSKHVEK